MAITIHTTPNSYYSVNGDLIWVISDATKASNPVDYPSYKYIADVYINGENVARIKKVPRPDNYMGIFNLSDIIRNYIEFAFNPTFGIRVQEFSDGEFFINVTVKFGEDYDFVIYADLVVDDQRMFFNHYNGRLLGQNTILGDYADKIASDRPATTDVQLSDSYTFIPYFPTTEDPVSVVFTKYGSVIPDPITLEWGYSASDPGSDPELVSLQFSGEYASGLNNYALNFSALGNNKYLVVKEPVDSPVKTSWFNTSFNYGTMPDSVFESYKETGGYRYYYSRIPVILDTTNYNVLFTNGLPNTGGGTVATESFTETFTPSEAYALQQLNISPVLVNSLQADFLDANTEYYTVQIGTQTLRLNLACEPKYQNLKVHFLNALGGFDTKNFSKVSRKSIAIERTEFGKLPYNVNDSGAVSYYNGIVYNDTRSIYASQFLEKMTLNSDLLSDDEYSWLGQLIASPCVYIELSGYLVPCVITANDYEYKKQINDKLTNLTIDVEFGDRFNTQFR